MYANKKEIAIYLLFLCNVILVRINGHLYFTEAILK
jgi:hypothetical protein